MFFEFFRSARSRAVLFCAAAIVTLSQGNPASAQFQQVLGVDGTGFGQPMPAFAVTVPQGWQPKGGILWGSNDPCNSYGYEFSWAALSPDQRYGVAILPSMRWVNQGTSGTSQCAVMQIGSARDAIAIMMSRLIPDAQMIDYRPRPDALIETGLQAGQYDLGSGSWMKTHVDAGEALFSFSDDKGNPMRATIGLAGSIYETYFSGGGVMPDMQFIQGSTLPAWLAFAPAGELNLAISEQMRKSVKVNPDWQRRISDHRAKIDGDNRRTQTNIANINREANAYVSRLSQEGYQRRSEAIDRNSTDFSRMINERETWRDTDGTQLDVPAGGNNLWKLDDGSYLSTNDNNLNPLASTGQFGTQLERWE